MIGSVVGAANGKFKLHETRRQVFRKWLQKHWWSPPRLSRLGLTPASEVGLIGSMSRRVASLTLTTNTPADELPVLPVSMPGQADRQPSSMTLTTCHPKTQFPYFVNLPWCGEDKPRINNASHLAS